MYFLLIHIIDLHTPINNPNNNAAKKQGISGREPRESRAAQPTIPAKDIHINRQYLRSTGPPAPTTYAPRSSQAKLALILTRRHTTTDCRRQRGVSEQKLAYDADAGSWPAYVALCPHLHIATHRAYPWAFQSQHGSNISTAV